jgi:molecular chaperone GrpE
MKKKVQQNKASDGDKEQLAGEPAGEGVKPEEVPADEGNNEQDIVRDMEKKLEETNDRFLRLFSEFDNYRKRTAKEKLELVKTASEDIITALLPVLDDLERACSLETPEGRSTSSNEGLSLIMNKFKAILRQKGVEEIPGTGHEFDTDLHEAITHVPAGGKEQRGKIVDEVQKGYKLNGKVIRYARVVVAK